MTTASQSVVTGAERFFSNPLGDGVRYLSFLIRPEETIGQGASNGFFGLYLDSASGDDDLFIGKPGNSQPTWVLENRGGLGQSATNYSPASGQTDLIVLKMELQDGKDQFTLWVNRPIGATDPPSFDGFKGDLDTGDLSGIALYGTGAFSVDEIRIGTSYADVVPATAPEPGSAVLLALLGAVGLPARHVRRKAGRRNAPQASR